MESMEGDVGMMLN